MLQWRVGELLIEKGHTQTHKWLMKQNIVHNTSYRLLHNKAESLNLKHINSICEAAYCTPNDLLVWTPDNETKFPATHPMQALRARTLANINLKLKTLSPEQIIELGKIVDGMR